MHPTSQLRTGERLAEPIGQPRRVPGPSPLPWLAGAALPAMVVVAACRVPHRPGTLDPDLPGGE